MEEKQKVTDSATLKLKQVLGHDGARYAGLCLFEAQRYQIDPIALATEVMGKIKEDLEGKNKHEKKEIIGELPTRLATTARLMDQANTAEVQHSMENANNGSADDAMHHLELLSDLITTPPVSSVNITLAPYTFNQPLSTYKISSPFGKRHVTAAKHATKDHPGVDLEAPGGADVSAVMPGVVKSVKHTQIGDIITISHGTDTDGQTVETRYIHMSHPSIKAGEAVAAGQKICKVAAHVKDRSDWTGPHLHLEVNIDGKHVDPAPYIRSPNPKTMALTDVPDILNNRKTTPVLMASMSERGMPVMHLTDAPNKGRIAPEHHHHQPAPVTVAHVHVKPHNPTNLGL